MGIKDIKREIEMVRRATGGSMFTCDARDATFQHAVGAWIPSLYTHFDSPDYPDPWVERERL